MLHYQTHGSPEQPAACFIHGFMGSSSDWTTICEAMSDDTFSVCVDLPGHGQSLNRPDYEYSMEGATQALADVLDDAGVDRCTLVGYSMGGRAALYFALNHPERVQRLILESAHPGLRSPEDRKERLKIDVERSDAIESDLSSFLKSWYRSPLFDTLDRHGLVDGMIETRSANTPSEIARALRGLSVARQPSLWDRLDELAVPTLVLTGALDEKYVDVALKMTSAAPIIETILVPGAGHNVHAERSQAFLSHLVHFMART
jgi:2-succinyl-6-hydroxy-2,4-cyclohexadiene-1-carboxylate synthase